ncbi:MAG TPA: HAD-IIB family hydrolase [Gammaproteobacteria bacterium]|nr:HAD-IIB family hydrolase [Gammaproteobacteria bacterium]
MRYHILATDYDGTLAHGGAVSQRTLDALKRLLGSGRKLVMVTGRELPDLQRVFPHLDLFELVVAENGALLYRPATKTTQQLAPPPPPEFVAELRERGVGPMSVGEVVVATWEPHSQTMLDAIRDLGLDLQVIFNKGAVMALPTGVNKASGLAAALRELKMSAHNAVGIGDAENDHSFMKLCEVSVAVANALPSVKSTADVVTEGDHGDGATELVDHLLRDDLASVAAQLARRRLTFGDDAHGEVKLEPYGGCTLICGASASGKSTVAKRLVESLREQAYQFCLVDPEGDYESLGGAVVVGKPSAAPSLDDALQLLEDVGVNGVVCLTGVPISDRPKYFVDLFAGLLKMRVRYGRPHWLVLDEAHHLMPAAWQPPNGLLPEHLRNVVLVTVHPELLSLEVLQRVTDVIAAGPTAPDILARLAEVRHVEIPAAPAPRAPGEVLLWSERDGGCRLVRVRPPTEEHRRHTRKYAEGRLSAERSFYFRGRDKKLNLRAQNLIQFLELAEGVDAETWEFHLHKGDYSKWFREHIKDEELANEAAELEGRDLGERDKSLAKLRDAIGRRYTLPASPDVPVRGAE